MKLQYIVLSLTGLASFPSIFAIAVSDVDDERMSQSLDVEKLMSRSDSVYQTELD